jgi:hypothetical protein
MILSEKGETNAPAARTIRVGGFTCVRACIDLTVATFAGEKKRRVSPLQ